MPLFLNMLKFFDNCFDLQFVDFVEHFSPTALKIYVVYRLIAGRDFIAKFKNLSLDINDHNSSPQQGRWHGFTPCQPFQKKKSS